MYQMTLALSEGASTRIERLIGRTCPKHPGTTIDGRGCAVCAVEAPAHPNHWTCDCRACQAEHVRVMGVEANRVSSPWVRAAAESSLPYKAFR